MKEKTRSVEHLEFYCTECRASRPEQDEKGNPEVSGGGPLEFESRRAAMMHNKTTGHRVVGKIIYMYDYPHFDLPVKKEECDEECPNCQIG